jgi:hypothetical protein
VNSNSIDREQSFQMTVNRDSDVIPLPQVAGIQSSASRWSAAPSIRKIGRKTGGEVGGARACPGIPSWVGALVRVGGRKDVSWAALGAPSVPIGSLRYFEAVLAELAEQPALRQGLHTSDKRSNEWKNFGATPPLEEILRNSSITTEGSVMLGRFRERFSKGLCESLEIRSSRGPPFREIWLGNPIFWIEVAGGTLDPKNWMKT